VNAEWAKPRLLPGETECCPQFQDVFVHTKIQECFDLLKFGKFEPPVPGYDFVRDNVIEPVMTSIVDDPTADVKALLDQANIDANAILAEQMAQIK
jgi:hypothetical protein